MRILYMLTICLSFNWCESHKILVVFPMRWISHGILGDSCVDLLLEAGHEITYVLWGWSPIKSHPNLTVIDISYPFPIGDRYSLKRKMNQEGNLNNVNDLSMRMSVIQRKIVENEQIQKLLNDSNASFDLAILEWMYGDFIVGLPAVFGCPYIWFSTMEPHPLILNLISEDSNPAYAPVIVFTYIAPLTFIQRIWSLRALLSFYIYKRLYIEPLEEKEFQRLIAPLISKRRHVVPSYSELRYNASLILGNSHISVGNSIPLPQAYKAVGGYHVKKNREPLSMELKQLMDNSSHGVIYFSMGSGLKDMPVEVIEQILKIFSELKQTVLWKIEMDLPNMPSNVHTLSWAPQQSILAHQNCVLFISHGGQLSALEAVHFGVPLIGIPVFADQNKVVKTLARSGMAKEVTLSYDMSKNLKAAIQEILGNASYVEAAKMQSFIYHHRPASPEAELVHWVEHVIQTKGAHHLRCIASVVPWYQKCYLDLVIVIILVMILLNRTLKWLLRRKTIIIQADNGKKRQ